MEFTAEIVEKAVCQFYQVGGGGNQTEINCWLTLAQISPQAWDFCWDLIKPDKKPEVQFFGANALHTKIARFWHELPTDRVEPLRSQILQLVVNFAAGPRMVLTRLCVTLSSFLLQTMPELWPDAVENLVTTFSQPSAISLQTHQADAVLFEVLTVLPEEFITSHLLPQRRGQVRNELQKSLAIVVPLLQKFFHTETGAHAQAMRCFSSWAQFGLPLPDSENLIELVFQAVRSSEHREAAIEALIHFFCHAENYRFPQSMQRILVHVVTLDDVLETAISDRDMETCQGLCKLIVMAADHNITLLLNCSLGELDQMQLASRIINLILRCTGMPGHYPVEECCSDFPFGFWYNFQDEVTSAEGTARQRLFQIYLPLFSHLVDILLKKVQYPPDQEYSSWDADEKEALRCYRQDIADALMYLYNVLKQPLLLNLCRCLDIILDRSTTQHVSWQEIEAVLFALTSLAEGVGPEDIGHLAPAFNLLQKIQSDNHMLLSQALYFIGAFSEWMDDNPQLLISALPILLRGLKDENLVLAATLSLKEVLRENQLHISPFTSEILTCIKEVLDDGKLKPSDEARLYWSMGYVLAVLPFNEILDFLNIVLGPCVETIRSCASAETITSTMRSTIVHKLNVISSLFCSLNVDLNRDEGGAEEHENAEEGASQNQVIREKSPPKEKKPQPVLFIAQQISTVIHFVLQKLSTDPTIVYAVCDMYKHALRTLMDDFSQLLPDVTQMILTTYRCAMNPAILDLAKQILVLFDNDQSISALNQSLFTELCNQTLSSLNSGNLKELTDIMEALMSFLSQITKKSVGLMKDPSTNLSGLYRAAVFGMLMQESPTSKASCQFLTVFIVLGQDMVEVQEILNTQGHALVAAVIKAIGGECPRFNIEPMVDVVLALNKHHFALLCKLMNDLVQQDGFPNQRVTREEKEQFARRVLQERTNKRKLKEVIYEHTLRWRGLFNTEYASQTSALHSAFN